MRELLPRYMIGILVGVCWGLLFPNLIPLWCYIPILLATVVITEWFGHRGFVDHWNGYRTSSYARYGAVVVCVLVGILVGSGKVGSFLIAVGTLVSR